MRRFIVAGAVAAAAFASVPASAAIIFTPGVYTPVSYTTATVFEDFNGTPDTTVVPTVNSVFQESLGGSNPSNSIIRTGNQVGVTADPTLNGAPGTGSVPYLAVGAGSVFTVSFTTPVQLFSFILGSLDTYNHLTLTFSDNTSTTLSGADIVGLPAAAVGLAGSNNSTTTGRVTYDQGGGLGIKSVSFSSDYAAFEIDGLSAAVPEPAAWGMMILGVGLVGSQLRTRRRKVTFATA